MTNEQIKQAYVISRAARGVKRYHTLQKQAMQKQAEGAWDTVKQVASDYAKPVGIPMGIGAILGAIINGAQGKSMLKGLLSGGAIAGLGSAGYKALNDNGLLDFKENPDAVDAESAITENNQ